ncbi:MAG: peptidoglycan DD-metalloendopeptidase family protein [Rhodocyclaceae bacterium]|nr:peptidoglycan DD-metalloendopeptidase family protein [Rhodocyclaceae bacterium]
MPPAPKSSASRVPLAQCWVFLLTLIVMSAMPARAQSKREDVEALRARIQALQAEIKDAEGDRADAASELRRTEQAISVTSRKLHEARGERARLEAESAALGERIDALERAQREHLARLRRAAPAWLAAPGSETWLALLQPDAIGAAARERYWRERIARAQVQWLTGIRTERAQLDALRAELGERRKAVAELEAEQARARAELDEERRAHGQLLARIADKISRQRREVATLKRDEARLSKLIAGLARVVPERRARGARPAEPAAGTAPARRAQTLAMLPTPGELVGRFGAPRTDGGTTWKGLFIRAQSGSPVRAIHAGQVVFSDWLRGYGNLMIVDHGGETLSIYAGNEALFKRVGDEVEAGDTIAAVGRSGGMEESGLYFEIRHRGIPQDPLRWFKGQAR